MKLTTPCSAVVTAALLACLAAAVAPTESMSLPSRALPVAMGSDGPLVGSTAMGAAPTLMSQLAEDVNCRFLWQEWTGFAHNGDSDRISFSISRNQSLTDGVLTHPPAKAISVVGQPSDSTREMTSICRRVGDSVLYMEQVIFCGDEIVSSDGITLPDWLEELLGKLLESLVGHGVEPDVDAPEDDDAHHPEDPRCPKYPPRKVPGTEESSGTVGARTIGLMLAVPVFWALW